VSVPYAAPFTLRERYALAADGNAARASESAAAFVAATETLVLWGYEAKAAFRIPNVGLALSRAYLSLCCR
jgi:hypothetical protein